LGSFSSLALCAPEQAARVRAKEAMARNLFIMRCFYDTGVTG